MTFANRHTHSVAVAALFLLTFLAQAATIDFFSPTGEVKKVRQVSVRFSEQMVNFGDPREVAPFDIKCPAEGKGRWADQQNWVYDFKSDLPAGVACSFAIKNELTSLKGSKFAHLSYSFNTGGPAILQSEPYSNLYSNAVVDENQVFILGLDSPATPESIQKNVHCQVEGIAEQIPVKLITGKLRTSILGWRDSFMTQYYRATFRSEDSAGFSLVFGIDEHGSDREKFLKLRDGDNSPIVVLQCQRTFPNEAQVKLIWGKGVTSKSGISTSQDQVLQFKARPTFEAKFSCERSNEKAGCIAVLPMTLNFTSPITVDNAQHIKLVSTNYKPILPVITEKVRKGGFVNTISFPTPLPELTAFKIVLPDVFTDDAGRSLSNAASFPLEVHTDENPPIAKFSSRFGILELNASPNNPPLLPITMRNVEPSLNATLAYTSIPGKTLHDNSELSVLSWMKRLHDVDANQWPGDERGPGKLSIFEEGGVTKAFTVPKPLGDKAFEVVGIPLPEPGFYVVELASPRLGAALFGDGSDAHDTMVKKIMKAVTNENQRPYYVHAEALVTNLAVHFKQGRESSLVWVTSLDMGKPVPSADVAVRDCSGKIYAQGSTDSRGILQIDMELPETGTLPNCLAEYDHQYFVTARLGKDFSFVMSNWNEGIALWRFNAFQTSSSDQIVAHAVMDRTLLRAGETVHIKIIERRKTGTGFNVEQIHLPRIVTIQHEGSGDKFDIPVYWDESGTTTLEWAVPQDAKQGEYVILMPEAVGSFQVESFRLPTMSAILQPAENSLINTDHVSLNLQVNYLAGGGASFLPVKLRGQISQKFVTFPDYEDFTFANGAVKLGIQKNASEPWSTGGYVMEDADEGDEPSAPANRVVSTALTTQELRLDASGAGHGMFSNLHKSTVPQDVHAEMEYLDPNGETLTSTVHVPLWSSQVLVGIKPDGWMATVDHLKFQVVVLDTKGKPEAGQPVVVNAMLREYFSHRRRLIGGFYAFDNHSEIKAEGLLCQGVTDEKGLLYCDVKAPVAGNIILQAEAKDALGNASVANHDIYVAGDNNWWFDASDNDRIDLLPEKKNYEPGETARFQLRMPFKEADVLVTVEREGVLDSFVTHLTRANPTIEIPMKGHYSPNVFVSALAIRGRTNDVQPTALIDLGKPSFKMGLAEIKVGWANHELKVKVSTDKPVYHVREKAKVSVDIRKPDGSAPPKGSEAVLVAIDEGLLELKPNDSWKLLEAMMARRGIEVSTSTAQMQVIGKRHFGRKALAAGGDGGGKIAREMFDTLLFWQARVKLDGNGHAEAVVPLNDSITSFRVVAIATGSLDLFGTGSTSIQSMQDLMLFSGLPPVVRERDKFHAGFTVRNASDHAIEALVSAKQQFGINSVNLDPIPVNLPIGESRNIGWDITVPLDSETMKWDVSIRENGAKEDGDRLKVSQRVISAVPVRTLQATIMKLDVPQSIGVKLPEGAIPGRGGVKVIFRKQLGDGMGGVQEYMARYPYTCLEQQASQAIALQDVERWKGLMKKLPLYLDGNGLAKYWPMMREGDDTLTAYLVSVANEAGYEIPQNAMEKMREGLVGFVEGRIRRESVFPTNDLIVRKLAAIEALSRTGEVQSKWLDSITIAPNLWPTSGVIDWLSILHRKPEISGQSARQIEEAQQIIRSRLNFQGTTMGFSTERGDTLWWLMVDGDVNANRTLLTLLNEPQWTPDIPRLVRGALGRQLQGHWNTTVANAWGVLAMKEFSAKFEAAPVTGTTIATLDKDRFAAEWTGDSRSAEHILNWPTGESTMSISHSGDGKPWAMLQSLAALPLKEPLFTGYRVTREITPILQKTKGEWHKGDVARIRLDVDAQSDMTWVVVNDPIPSGASILGTGLGGDSKLLTEGEKRIGWVWPAFEERTFDSFHSYYRFVPKGKFAVEYTVRLNNEGTFQLPATRVEAMYAPEMFGELPNNNVLVMP